MFDDRFREVCSLALFAAGLFLAAALLTYRETLSVGPESGAVNVCGPVGASIAGFLLTRLGFVAWIGVLLLFRQGVRVFRRAEAPSSWGRLPGVVLFAVVLAATLSHLFEGASATIPDPGGEVGIAVESLVLDQAGLGSVGGRLTLLFLFLTTFVLASGLLYSEFMVSFAGWWDQRDGMRSLWPFGDSSATRATTGPGRGRRRADRGSGVAVAEEETESDADEEYDESEEEYEDEETEDDADTEWEDEDAEEDAEEEWEEESEALEDDAPESAPEPWDAVDAELNRAEPGGDDSDSEDGEEGLDDYGFDVAVEGDEDEGEWEDDEAALAAEPEPEIDLHGSPMEPVQLATAGDESATEPAGSDSLDEEALLQQDVEQGGDGLVVVDPLAGPAREAPSSQPTEERRPYVFPPLELLTAVKAPDAEDVERSTHETARKLTAVLASFKIEAKVVGVQNGPSIRMFEVELAAGTKLGRLRSLEDDLAMNLAAASVRIVAPIPGRSTAGIELPIDDRETVTLRELLEWPRYVDRKFAIPFFLGKGSAGQPLVADLAAMPHLLVAGATGAGKSVCLNTMIMSLLYKRTPEQVQMILIDPKMVELSLFKEMPHLMCPVVTDMKRAAGILEWAVEKMEARYHLLHEVEVRNIQAYNRLGEERLKQRLGDGYGEHIEGQLPYIVIVIDELADLMMNCAKDVEQSITRLAQKSRAVGIHVVLATQRPSTNVLTGLIKANLPTRIAFRVASKIDSRVILDANGADKLLGEGDMLFLPPKASDLVRVQGTFVEDDEIHDVMKFIAEHSKQTYSRELMQKRSKSDQDPSVVDVLFDDAAKFVVESRRGSASLLQRRYQIGYTRASRLIDLMASEGLLGEYRGSQAREVLVTPEELEGQRTEALARMGNKGAGGSGLYDEQESES